MTNTIASMINYFDTEKNNHDYLEYKLIPTLAIANRHTYSLVVGEFDGNTSRAIEKIFDVSTYHKKTVIVDDVSTLHQLHTIFKHHSNEIIIFKDTYHLLSYPELLDYMNSIIEKSEYQVPDTTNQFTGHVILISNKRLASIPDGIKSRANIIIKRSIFDLVVLWITSVTSYFTF